MKRICTLLTFLFLAFCVQAQEVNGIPLKGSCLNPDEGTIDFIFDLNENCPEADPNGELPGVAQMGFHSGANEWASIVEWDSPDAVPAVNNGSDTFTLTVNVLDYYGIEFADLLNVKMVINNGFANPDDPWTVALRDSTDGMSFGDPTDCSDLQLFISDTPTCKDAAQESSLSIFSDAGDSKSCVDSENGTVKIDLDYDLACPEGDSAMLLVGAVELGFHSGANDWASIVAWDDPNAVTLTNDGNDNFSAIIDVQAYYGLPLADLVNIQMVANNGPSGGDPWANVIKDPRNGGFGGTDPCSDLKMIISEAPDCNMVSTVDIELQHSFKVTPNPFRNRTFLEFDNPNNRTFELIISNLAGQTMRRMSGIIGERVLIEREGLPTGMFIANLIDENGNFATTKLVVK